MFIVIHSSNGILDDDGYYGPFPTRHQANAWVMDRKLTRHPAWAGRFRVVEVEQPIPKPVVVAQQ